MNLHQSHEHKGGVYSILRRPSGETERIMRSPLLRPEMRREIPLSNFTRFIESIEEVNSSLSTSSKRLFVKFIQYVWIYPLDVPKAAYTLSSYLIKAADIMRKSYSSSYSKLFINWHICSILKSSSVNEALYI
jgi:hypothetical protein